MPFERLSFIIFSKFSNAYVERQAIREQEKQLAMGLIDALELMLAADPRMEQLLQFSERNMLNELCIHMSGIWILRPNIGSMLTIDWYF